MATQAKYILIDDIDGSNAKDTITFAVGRTQYEIDLNLQHIDEFNRDLDKWIKHARRVPARRQARQVRTGVGPSDAPQIREWAKDRGIELARRGRIPVAVREQYQKEVHGS